MEALSHRPPSALRRDSTDPKFQAVELAQRGRMILDVAAADLEEAERRLGPFHPTSWHFRNALAEAKMAWDRLRAELGGATLKAAMAEAPCTYLTLGDDGIGNPIAILIPIDGQTYHVRRVAGTASAPVQWRLRRLRTEQEGGLYYVCRLAEGLHQCDCADWTYRITQSENDRPCKHQAALIALGWL